MLESCAIQALVLRALSLVWQRKYRFGGQFFEIEILIDLHILRPSKSKNHIFIS